MKQTAFTVGDTFGHVDVPRRQFLGSLGLGTIALLIPTEISAGVGVLATGKIVSLRCLGPKLAHRYLEGRTNGTLGLVSQPNMRKNSGTRWKVVERRPHLIALSCLVVDRPPRWLEGRPTANGAGLTAPANQPPDFCTWRVVPADSKIADIVGLELEAGKSGSRWLEAKESGAIGLASAADVPPGGRWEVRMHPVPID